MATFFGETAAQPAVRVAKTGKIGTLFDETAAQLVVRVAKTGKIGTLFSAQTQGADLHLIFS
jgi:hypothetical protein